MKKVFKWDFDGRNQASCGGEICEFEHGHESKVIVYIATSSCQESDAKKQL